MKAFVSWSGGKDCMYAMYRFLQNEKDNEVAALVNMCDTDGIMSRSHGLKRAWIERQARAMQTPLIQQPIENSNYEQTLKKVMARLKKEGVNAGIFGDIYLQEHRTWIERVCNDMFIQAVFPLWGIDVQNMMQQFVDDGFQSIVVSIRKDKLDTSFLGKKIDAVFIEKMKLLPDIDICGENGEYHTYVFDGPLFHTPVVFTTDKITESKTHWFITLV